MSVKKELENIIKSGKSVFHKGVHYTTLEEIPSESDLSKGDAEQEEAARRSIKAELRRLAEELAVLDDDKEAKSSAKKVETKASKPSEGGHAGDKPVQTEKSEKPVEDSK